jgi:DNA-binding transcriptional MerR regulator
MKIGELAKATGLTAKTIRYYELLKLLGEPQRTESGYRLYGQETVERLDFIKKAKRLGLSLDEIKDILALHEKEQVPCIHVLALLDRKVSEVEKVIQDLKAFRQGLMMLREESAKHLENLPKGAAICGVIERGIHHRGELALAWLEGRQMGKLDSKGS